VRAKARMGFEDRTRRARPAPRYESPETREARRRLGERFRYRFMMLDRAAGPWRSSHREALTDAIRAGEASRCDKTRAAYFGVFAWIDRRELEPQAVDS
jgi:hypothetical protein